MENIVKENISNNNDNIPELINENNFNLINSKNTLMNYINISHVSDGNSPSSCGYCKEKENSQKINQNYSIGFSSKKFTPEMYEKLMFIGWRRCGDYIYRPLLKKNCCKSYSIRLNINEFKINKKQKKVIKNFKNFLIGKFTKENFNEKNKNKEIISQKQSQNQNQSQSQIKIENENEKDNEKDNEKENQEKKSNFFVFNLNNFLKNFIKSENFSKFLIEKLNYEKENILSLIKNDNININIKIFQCKIKSLGQFSTDLFISIANRLKENLKKNNFSNLDFYKEILNLIYIFLKEKGEISLVLEDKIFYFNQNDLNINLSEKTGHFNFLFSNESLKKIELDLDKDKSLLSLSLPLGRALPLSKKNNKEKNKNDNNNNNIININNDNNIIMLNTEKEKALKYCLLEEFDYPFLFENSIYKSESEKINNYTISLEKNSDLSNEKFNIYKKYQINIHKEKDNEINKKNYLNSWGNTNLLTNFIFDKNKLKGKLSEKEIDLIPDHFGTWDLIHRINGKIIAVGVLDILPTSISSCYLYYDTDFSFLNIGVFTALKEIEYTKFLQKNLSEKIKYYVLGFYIHDCQKMRYKGEYFPSEILCPESLKFFKIDENNTKRILNEKKNIALCESNQINKYLYMEEKVIDEFINKKNIEYNEKEYSLEIFINEIFRKYKDIILSIVRELFRHLNEENFMEIKFTI
jgi:arginine-tRNA-protein transferase